MSPKDPVSPQTLDFEAAMERLVEVVRELESPQLKLERAMALCEEGQKLGSACRMALEAARVRVDRLLESGDGGNDTAPFDPQ